MIRAVSSQCPEINWIEPEDEQNERVRQCATGLNKRDDLNTRVPPTCWGSVIAKPSLQKQFAFILALRHTRRKMCLALGNYTSVVQISCETFP